jgi:hypothetical protein
MKKFLKRQLIISSKLLKLADEINKKNLFIRKGHYDLVVGGLLAKAFRTHKAIRMLAWNGFGTDAYALSRHILELAIVFNWMLYDDNLKRTERYAKFLASTHARTKRIKEKYYPNMEVKINKKVEVEMDKVAHELFNYDWHDWAGKKGKDKIKLAHMADDLKFDFGYDYLVFDTSAYVHSNIDSLQKHIRNLREKGLYFIDLNPDMWLSDYALYNANMSLISMLNTANSDLGLGLDSQITEIWSAIEKE